jgi:hypothetical protein
LLVSVCCIDVVTSESTLLDAVGDTLYIVLYLFAGIGSDRFARFNHDVKLAQHKAQLKLQGQSSDVAHFDHSLDFMTQLQVNSLCQQLGLRQPYPFLDPDKLCGSAQ